MALLDCDRREMPTLDLDVFKEGALIESISLQHKACFRFGRAPASDVTLLHESVSLSHAAFLFDKEQGAMLVDLGSQYGTFLNGARLEPNTPTKLAKKGDVVTFAESTRSYKVTVDYSRMQRAAEEALKALQ